MSVTFERLASDHGARRGLLTTPRGRVETPAFMPVGTAGSVKAVTPEEVRESLSGLRRKIIKPVKLLEFLRGQNLSLCGWNQVGKLPDIAGYLLWLSTLDATPLTILLKPGD